MVQQARDCLFMDVGEQVTPLRTTIIIENAKQHYDAHPDPQDVQEGKLVKDRIQAIQAFPLDAVEHLVQRNETTAEVGAHTIDFCTFI